MRVLFFLLITIFISSAQAAVDVCLDKASVDEIVAEFPFQEIAANGKKLDPRQDVKVDLCDSSSLSYKIAEALLFIKNLPALKSRGDIFDTGFLGASPFQFIKDRIPSIYFESVEEAATSTCDKYTVAVASIDGSLHICPDSVNYSKIYLSGAMVHESRHFDGNIFEHQICTRGPESILGQFACDQNYEFHGSYGVQTEFLVKIWRETSLPMELRREAKRLATELLMFSFVESPVGLEEGALLLGEKNDLSFFDGETLRKIAVLPGEGVVISLRLNLPVLFDAEAGTVHTLGTDGVYEDTQGPLAQIYREMPKEERAAVIDVFYGKRFSCFLSIKSVFCKSDKNSVNVELPSEMEAAQFVVMGNSPGGEQNFIMSKAGIYYSFPFDLMSSGPINIGSTPRPLDQWKTEDFAISEFLSDYKGVGFFQGSQLITLLPSGELALYSADSGQAYVAVPRLAGHKFKRLFLPYFWSPRFSDL